MRLLRSCQLSSVTIYYQVHVMSDTTVGFYKGHYQYHVTHEPNNHTFLEAHT